MMFQTPAPAITSGKIYCPLCTHTVHARIVQRSRPQGNKPHPPVVGPGQRCPHCSGSLDAGYIMQSSMAA